jgi:sec-independent protein translocase protein TatC
MKSPTNKLSFWEHVEVMRWMLIRCAMVVFGLAVVVFCLKDFIFNTLILSPCNADFITYEWLCKLAAFCQMPSLCPQIESIELININLSAQLFTHISISFYIAIIVSIPYLMLELWLFLSPALYKKEIKPAIKGALWFTILFVIGLLLAYLIIFPLTLNFLGTYQVSERVINQISLNSYINTFLTLLFMMGLVFEMPVVAYFLASIGVLTSNIMSKYRKVAIVIVLTASAFITPSTDIFTMLLVAIPLQLLYEFSRIVVKKVENRKK